MAGQNLGRGEVEVDARLDPKSVRRVGKELEVALRRAGKTVAKDFTDKFGEEMTSSQQRRAISQSLDRALVQRKAASVAGSEVANSFSKALRQRIRDSVKDNPVGDLIAVEVVGQFERRVRRLPLRFDPEMETLDFDKDAFDRLATSFSVNLPAIVDDANDKIIKSNERATAELGRIAEKAAQNQLRLEEKQAAERARIAERSRMEMQRISERAFQEQMRLEDKEAKARIRVREQLLITQQRIQSSFTNDLRRVRGEVEAFSRGIVKDFETVAAGQTRLRQSAAELNVRLERIAEVLGKNSEEYRLLSRELDHVNNTLRRSRPVLINYERRVNLVGTAVGKAFGRGSRSELINFFGVLAERGTRVFLGIGTAALKFTGLALNAAHGVGNLIGAFREGVQESGKLTTGFLRMGQAAGTALIENLNPAGLIAMAVAAVAAATSIGVLSAVVSSLVGALAALAVAVGGALVGGLGLLVGALLPVVVGIGGMVAAVKSLDKESKKALKEAVKPLTEELKGLGKEFAKSALPIDQVKADIKDLTRLLRRPVFEQFAQNVGTAMNDVRKSITDNLTAKNGPFEQFVESMSKSLPGQLRSLGDIFNDTFNGWLGFFVAIQPAVDQFLDRLSGVAERFSTFTNSPEGQKSLSDFFLKAEDALASVGNLLKEVGDAFATMFKGPAGDAGIQLIDDMADKVGQFVDFLNNNPGKVQAFFEGAVQIARDVGNAILVVSVALGSLNTPENRAIASLIFDAIAFSASAMATAFKFVHGTITLVVNSLGFVVTALGHLTRSDTLKDLGSSMKNFGNESAEASRRLEALGGEIQIINGQQVLVKADSQEVVVADERTAELIRKMFPTYTVKVDPSQLKAAGNAAQDAGRDIDVVGSKHVKPTVSMQITGRTQLELLRQAIDRLKDKDIKITTHFSSFGSTGQTINAVGGIIGNGMQLEGGKLKKFAAGGILGGPTILAGEAGREAIVPLERSLRNIDPSVRALAAVAQGKAGVGGGGDTNITINQIHNGPQTGAEQLQQLEWLLRYSPRIGSTTIAGN